MQNRFSDTMWWKWDDRCLSIHRRKKSVAACFLTSWRRWRRNLRSNWRPMRTWSCSWQQRKIVVRSAQALSSTQLPTGAGLSSKQLPWDFCAFSSVYGWSSSRIKTLMLSLPLNTVALTVFFMSRPICETTFYCCLCQALETSGAWLAGVFSSCLANAVLGSGQADICLVSQRNSNRLFCFELCCT